MAAEDDDIKKEKEAVDAEARTKASPPPPPLPPVKGPVIKAKEPGQKATGTPTPPGDLLAEIRKGKELKKSVEDKKTPTPEAPLIKGGSVDALVAQAQAKAAENKDNDDESWDDPVPEPSAAPVTPIAAKPSAPIQATTPVAKPAKAAGAANPTEAGAANPAEAGAANPAEAGAANPAEAGAANPAEAGAANPAEAGATNPAAVITPSEPPVNLGALLAGKLGIRRDALKEEVDIDEEEDWDFENDKAIPKVKEASLEDEEPTAENVVPSAENVVPTVENPVPIAENIVPTAENIVPTTKAPPLPPTRTATAEEIAENVRKFKAEDEVRRAEALAAEQADEERPPVPPVPDEEEPREPPPVPVRSASTTTEQQSAAEASNALGIIYELDEENFPPVSVQPTPPQAAQATGPTVTAEEVKKAIRDSYNKLLQPDRDELNTEYSRARSQFEYSGAQIPNMEAAVKLVEIARKLESGTASKEERNQMVKDLKEFYQAVGKPPAPKQPQIEIERPSTLGAPPIKPAAKLAAETPIAKAPVDKPPVVEPPVVAMPVAKAPVGKPPVVEPPVVATPVASAQSNASPGDSTATPVTPPTLPATALPVTPNPTATLAAAPDQEPQADKEEDKDAFDQMKDSLDNQIKDWPQVKNDAGEALGEQIMALFAIAATLLKGTATIPLESVFNAKSDELKAIKRERENAQNRVDEIREDLEDADPGSEQETILTQNLETARTELSQVDQRMVQVANETHQAVREDLRNQVQNAGQDASGLESTRPFNAKPPVPSRGANDEPHREPPQVPLRDEGAPPLLSLEEQLARRREVEASKQASKAPPQPLQRTSSVSAVSSNAQPIAGKATPVVSSSAPPTLPGLPENALEKAQIAWNAILAKLPEADKASILSQSNIGNVLRDDNPALTGSAIQSLITLAKKDNISLADVQGVLQNFMPGQAASPTTSRPRAATMPITPTSEATASVAEVEAAAESKSIFRKIIGTAVSTVTDILGLKPKESERRASTPPPVQNSAQATTTPQTREETAREEALNVSTRSATPILRALTIEQGPQAAFGGLQMKLSELQAKIEPKKDSYGITNMKYFDTPPETVRGLEAKPTLSLEMQTDKPNVKNYVHLQNDAQGGIEFRASKNAADTTLQNICKLAVENAPPNTNFAVPAGAANADKIKEYLSAAIAAQPPERKEKLSVDGKTIDARATVTPRQEPSQTPNLGGSKSGG